jgi:hypothetical protein
MRLMIFFVVKNSNNLIQEAILNLYVQMNFYLRNQVRKNNITFDHHNLT